MLDRPDDGALAQPAPVGGLPGADHGVVTPGGVPQLHQVDGREAGHHLRPLRPRQSHVLLRHHGTVRPQAGVEAGEAIEVRHALDLGGVAVPALPQPVVELVRRYVGRLDRVGRRLLGLVLGLADPALGVGVRRLVDLGGRLAVVGPGAVLALHGLNDRFPVRGEVPHPGPVQLAPRLLFLADPTGGEELFSQFRVVLRLRPPCDGFELHGGGVDGHSSYYAIDHVQGDRGLHPDGRILVRLGDLEFVAPEQERLGLPQARVPRGEVREQLVGDVVGRGRGVRGVAPAPPPRSDGLHFRHGASVRL